MKFNYKDKSPRVEKTEYVKNEEAMPIKEENKSSINEKKVESYNPNTEIKIDIPSFSNTEFKEEINNVNTVEPESPKQEDNVSGFNFQDPVLDFSDNTSANVVLDTNNTAEEKTSGEDTKKEQENSHDIFEEEIINKDKEESLFSKDVPKGDETETSINNEIQLDEVFEPSQLNKEKKSIFGFGKKNKDKNSDKSDEIVTNQKSKKKGFVLPFGKKKKDLLDRLDEIAQTETSDKTEKHSIIDSLHEDEDLNNKSIFEDNTNEIFSDNSQKDLEQQNDFSFNEDNSIQKEENNATDDIPDLLKENEIPFDDYNTESTEQEETIIEQPNLENENNDKEENTDNEDETDFLRDSIFKKKGSKEIDLQDEKSQKSKKKKDKKSLTDSKKDINILEKDDEISNSDTETNNEFDIEPNKKNKNKLLPIIIALVVIVAGIGGFMAVKTLFGNNTAPVVSDTTSSENVDKDTVDSIVKETQEVVDNANSSAEQYEKNNELPPQVGVDIDEEINIENEQASTSTTKTYADNVVSFTYPSEWVEVPEFKTRTTDDNVTNIIMLGLTPTDVEDTNNMRITIEKTLTSITAKDYLAKTEELMKKSFTNIKTRKSAELTIAGREAPSRIYTFNDESGNSVEQFQIYVAKDRDIYVITFTSSEKNFAKNLETYKTILKTLKLE